MRKSTLFLSATLTTFMLAVMFGVASAYQKIVKAAGTDEVGTQQAQVQANNVVLPTATNSIVGSTMTIEQAANLASSVIGRTDLYTAEITQLDGVDVYLVTFSSGDIVYVSQNGQILSISKLPVTVILAPAAGGGGGGGGNGGGSGTTITNDNGNGNSNGDDYNDDDDHDDEDDDDDEDEDDHD